MTILAFDARGIEPRPRRRRRRVPWRRLLLLFVAAYALWIGAREWTAYRRLQQQITSTAAQVATVTQQNARLRLQLQEAQTPAYVEQEAQNELGLVPQNEIPFQPVQ